MFWDGSRWVDERERAILQPPRTPRRLRDWVATIPIILIVPALVLPFIATVAASPSLATSSTAEPGSALDVVGADFQAGWFQLTWDGDPTAMPSVKADPSGSFRATIAVPLTASAGRHVVSAVDRSQSRNKGKSLGATSAVAVASVAVDVTVAIAPSPSPSASLPPSGPTPQPSPVASGSVPSALGSASPAPSASPSASDPTASPLATSAPPAPTNGTPAPTNGPPAVTSAPSSTPGPTAAATASPSPTAIPTPTPAPTPPGPTPPAPTPSAAPLPTPTATATLAPTPAPTATPAPLAVACGSSLQARIDSAAAGSTLDLTGCSYSGSAVIAKPLTLVGATLRVPAGAKGISVTSSSVTLRGLTITGSQSTAYRSAENGVFSSTSITGLTIEDSEIANFGQAGVWVGPVSGLTVAGNSIHDVFYAGVMVLSGSGGSISGNHVQRVGVGWTQSLSNGGSLDANNAYGIALSQTGGPVTTDFTVAGNTVEDVPTWHALDTHSGVRIAFTDNTVRRSSRAIFVTSSVGRATDISVKGNAFLAPSPVTFNLLAITTVNTLDCTITGNTLQGWGGDVFQDYGSSSTGLVYSGNLVQP